MGAKIKTAVVLYLCLCTAQAKDNNLATSRASLLRQNTCIDQIQLERIQSLVRVAELVEQGVLSPLPIGRTLIINPTLPENRRSALPRTNAFLLSLSIQFYAKFGKSLVIPSAVRPVDTQKQLRKRNRNAAPAEGDLASSHESGATIDIGKKG